MKENKLKRVRKYIIKNKREAWIATISPVCKGTSNKPILAIPEKATIRKMLDSKIPAKPPTTTEAKLIESNIKEKVSYCGHRKNIIRITRQSIVNLGIIAIRGATKRGIPKKTSEAHT